jgi:hypothetical protein
MSVADNARDAVLLHVSSSSKGQKRGDKRGSVKKKRCILKLSHVYG